MFLGRSQLARRINPRSSERGDKACESRNDRERRNRADHRHRIERLDSKDQALRVTRQTNTEYGAGQQAGNDKPQRLPHDHTLGAALWPPDHARVLGLAQELLERGPIAGARAEPVSYTHLRAHET